VQQNLDLFSSSHHEVGPLFKQEELNGELLIIPNFLTTDCAEELFQRFKENIKWRQSEVFVCGKKHLEPRLTAWYGDEGAVYSYAKKKLVPEKWFSELANLKKEVERMIPGTLFNSVLVNLYRDGKDKMGWHADNEKELGLNPVIASLSLGATRFFDLKHKHDSSQKFRFELKSGMLLIMSGKLQENWLHQIPQQRKVHQPRINLTFRKVVY
jgi:alkylated DNA repair dioxygenase AlkB